MTHINQVKALRKQRQEEATRVFHARGKSVVRCEECMLASYACICDYCPSSICKSEFVLLMHRDEVFKPTNTGRLIADVLPSRTHAFCWHRTEPPAELISLLSDPQRDCWLIFPDKHAQPFPTESSVESAKTQTFILLDGTWKQARRMASLSRWLDKITRLSLPKALLKGYTVRKSLLPHQLSTAEAGALCLQSSGESTAAQALLGYFRRFNEHYLATRGCYAPEITTRHKRPSI